MFVAARLAPAQIAADAARAAAANRGAALIVADAAPVKPFTEDYARKVQGKGSVIQRQQWELALMGTWTLYGLPYGSPWVPCYLTGTIAHAWTLDGEHLDPVMGTRPGNMLLAVHEANRQKSDGGQINLDHATRLLAQFAGASVPTGPRQPSALYRAAWRRPGPRDVVPEGCDRMAPWVYGDPRPAHLIDPNDPARRA